MFDLDSSQIAQMLGPHLGEVTAFAWHCKAEFSLTASLDQSVGLWELKSRKSAETHFAILDISAIGGPQ